MKAYAWELKFQSSVPISRHILKCSCMKLLGVSLTVKDFAQTEKAENLKVQVGIQSVLMDGLPSGQIQD